MLSWVSPFNTRTGKGGGRFCPPLMFYVNNFRSIRSIAVIFLYLPKNNWRTFWCKNWRLVDFWGSIFNPQSQHFRFSPSWCHERGVLAPPPHRLAGLALRRPVARGGGRALGGAGRALGRRRRPPVKVTESGGRASLRLAATGRVADGGGPMKTNEGPGSIYLHVRHIALKIKMRVCKYYYSNYVLE